MSRKIWNRKMSRPETMSRKIWHIVSESLHSFLWLTQWLTDNPVLRVSDYFLPSASNDIKEFHYKKKYDDNFCRYFDGWYFDAIPRFILRTMSNEQRSEDDSWNNTVATIKIMAKLLVILFLMHYTFYVYSYGYSCTQIFDK